MSQLTLPTRRSVIAGATGLALGASLARPAIAADPDPIKIGCLNVYTKAGGIYGQAILDGMQLYLEQTGGKIAGRPVILLKEDDEFNPQVGLQKLRKLVEGDKVQLIAGPLGSHIAAAMAGYMKNTGTPWIITGAGDTALTRQRIPHMFRATLSNWQVADPMGGWAAEHVKKQAAIFASDYLAGHDVADAFKESFTKAGGKVVKEIYPPVGTTDFSAYISDLRSASPELTYVFFSGSDAVRFVKQFEQFGLKQTSQLVGFQSALDSDTFVGQGDSAIGALSSAIYCETLDTPENKHFVELFRARKHATPGVFGESGFTAARIIDDAAKLIDGRVEDREAFAAAIAKTDIRAPRGPVSFDPLTHQAIQNVYVRRVAAGEDGPRNVVIDTFAKVGDNPLNRA